MKYHSRKWVRILLTVIIDGIVVFIAFLTAYLLRAHSPFFEQTRETPFYPYLDLLPFVVILSLFSFHFTGTYRKTGIPVIDRIPGLFGGMTLTTLLLVLITYFLKMYPYSRIVFFLFWIIGFILLILWRIIVSFIQYQLRYKGLGLTKIVIIGTGQPAQLLIQEFHPSTKTGYHLLGLISESNTGHTAINDSIPILGELDSLPDLLEKYPVEEVFVTIKNLSNEKTAELTLLCMDRGIRLNYIPDLHEIIASKATLTEYHGIPLLLIEEKIFYLWNRIIKRAMDIWVSLFLFITTFPLLLIIFFLIRFDSKSKGPVFYQQERVGRSGKKFMMYKFRSMVLDAEKQLEKVSSLNIAQGPMFKIPNDPRITGIGGFIRRWSLDELPQLWNVLKNEMSLVGPRPPLPEEVEKYEEWQKKRLEIQPGMTGLWQVSGRSELSFDDMVKLDIYYIEHWSLWLDIKILLRTLAAVLQGKGAY